MRKTTGHGYETSGFKPKRGPLHETDKQRAKERKAFRDFMAKHGHPTGRRKPS